MSRNKHKILIIDNSTAFTGALKSITSVSDAMSLSVSSFFALPSRKMSIKMQSEGYKVYHIPFLEIQKNWRLLIYFPFLVLNSFRLKRIINENNIDIVHVNDLYNMCGVLLKLFSPSLKVVYHVRLLPSSYAKNLYSIWKRLIEKYADKILCVSKTVAANFKNDKTYVIYDSIPELNIKTKFNKKSSDSIFKIIYLANYVEGKGHKQAIDAYNLSYSKIPASHLIMYGGTLNKRKNETFKEHLISYAKSLGLIKKIIFEGFLPNPEQEISNADLMLNFSESESFSMTTLEALVYGTPIIATACGGPSEIIEDDKSGILVPVNDIQSMASSIIELANNAELRMSLAMQGKIRAKEKFDMKIQAQLLYMIYTRLL